MVLAFLVAMRRYSLFTAQFVLNVYFFVFVISTFSLFPTYSLLKQQQQQQQLYKRGKSRNDLWENRKQDWVRGNASKLWCVSVVKVISQQVGKFLEMWEIRSKKSVTSLKKQSVSNFKPQYKNAPRDFRTPSFSEFT